MGAGVSAIAGNENDHIPRRIYCAQTLGREVGKQVVHERRKNI